jgi:hypothetical protein
LSVKNELYFPQVANKGAAGNMLSSLFWQQQIVMAEAKYGTGVGLWRWHPFKFYIFCVCTCSLELIILFVGTSCACPSV